VPWWKRLKKKKESGFSQTAGENKKSGKGMIPFASKKLRSGGGTPGSKKNRRGGNSIEDVKRSVASESI